MERANAKVSLSGTWRFLLVAALAALATVVTGVASVSPASAELSETSAWRWVATWSAAPMADGTTLTGPSRSFADQTVRQIVRVSVGGSRVRVQLSNEYGVRPLAIRAAHVALAAAGASIVPESDRTLTFDGESSVSIPEGESRLSDPVPLRTSALADLAISLYVPEDTGPATYHAFGNQTAFISGPGDFSAALDFPAAETSIARFWLTVVEALPARRVGALVAIGDSITDGGESTLDANQRWTDFLSQRLNRERPRLSVLNQGIGCGRLLRDFCGPSVVSRFERDVLDVTGVTAVALATGFTDIFFPTAAGTPDELVSADEIIVALRQLARQAHQRGLEVYGATYTPNEGTTFENVFTPENEAKRQAVNQWIRSTRALDGVFDFDAAARDPEQPTRLLPEYASVDKLLVVPGDLVDGFARARLASDVHPPVLEQSILAAFMLRGHYQRHLRRMQAVYAERLDALQSAIERTGAALRLRPVHSGLHAVADLETGDAEQVARAAAARNLETMPLSAYHYTHTEPSNALVLGFGAVRPVAIRAGVSQLAAAIDDAGP
ncbi:MAG: GDSL-type esterase/lipase family protein [Deltaproteobacteria bacterium]